jgi:hypothetical protein
MTNKEFKKWQKDMKRQIAESGLTEEQWVDRWLDMAFGPDHPQTVARASSNALPDWSAVANLVH